MRLLNVGEIGLEFGAFLGPLVILLPIPASASVDSFIYFNLHFMRFLRGSMMLQFGPAGLMSYQRQYNSVW